MRACRCIAAALALLALGAAPALAHQGNPNYRSTVTRVTPPTPGVSIRVADYDDHLLLIAQLGHSVQIEGYDHDVYARVLTDRTVQVNTNSQAYYLNEDRYADVTVPDGVGNGPARWKTVSHNGRFQWHDHRIHWMSPTDPPQLRDKHRRTHILDWTVPMRVDGRPVKVAGTLFWVPPPSGGMPAGAIAGFVVVAVVLGLGTLVIRRRPARRGGALGRGHVEAW